MGIKDILVYMNSSRGCSNQVDAAIQLTRDFDAHLTGLYTYIDFVAPSYADMPMPVAVIEDMQACAVRREAEVHARFVEVTEHANQHAEWRSVKGDSIRVLNLHGRYVDLVVCPQSSEAFGPFDDAQTANFVALQCSRPVLVIPASAPDAAIGGFVYVAWDGSREATRAIADALPFLKRAEQVKVVTVNVGRRHRAHGDVPGVDVALHLARHGVPVEVQQLESDELGVGELLLTRATEEHADLIVMGAYGHSRIREFIFGGVTRYVLQHMPVPVLFSH